MTRFATTPVHVRAAGMLRCDRCGALVVNNPKARDDHGETHGWERPRRRESVMLRGARVPNGAKTHCPRGHELFGDNLRVSRNGSRRCKTCDSRRQKLRSGWWDEP